MTWVKWLGVLILAGILGWLGGMTLYNAAHAKGYDGLHVRPRGPGGPPVVVPDDPTHVPAAWQIKIAVFDRGPQGTMVTYGDPSKGAVEFATEAECEDAVKHDRALNFSLNKVREAVAPHGYQVKPFCVHFAAGERVD